MLNKNELSKYVLQQLKDGNIKKDVAIELVKRLNVRNDIAIIGMATRFGESDNYEDYWDLVNNKQTIIERCDKARIDLFRENLPPAFSDHVFKYCKGGYLKKLDYFDNEFFQYTKEIANYLHPSIRTMLEMTYRALEDAGCLGEHLENNKMGVFIGNNYTKENMFSYLNICLANSNFAAPFESMINNWTSGLTTRISNFFNLKGPSFTIDASCPSSSIAIANACAALRDNMCTTAVAGGLIIDMSPVKIYSNQGWIFVHEDDIIMKLFDENQRGAFHGEAAGMVVLKPLEKAIEDGDRIHGILCGSSFVNNGSNGDYMQCSPQDIKQAVIDSFKLAQVDAEDVGYVLTEGYPHSTEEGLHISGIASGFKAMTNKRQFCSLGGITPNVGYGQSSIGVMNAIMNTMALEKKIIPPAYRFVSPISIVDFSNSPFYINDMPLEWECEAGKSRYAANQTYGYGGINMFNFIKEAPVHTHNKESGIRRKEIFTLSSATKYSMMEYVKAYIEYLEKDNIPELTSICYAANTRRQLCSEYRLAIICDSTHDLRNKLKDFLNNNETGEFCYFNERDNHYTNRKIWYESVKNKELSELAKDFAEGRNIRFSELYEGIPLSFCELPRYPFDRKSCWSVKKEENDEEN